RVLQNLEEEIALVDDPDFTARRRRDQAGDSCLERISKRPDPEPSFKDSNRRRRVGAGISIDDAARRNHINNSITGKQAERDVAAGALNGRDRTRASYRGNGATTRIDRTRGADQDKAPAGHAIGRNCAVYERNGGNIRNDYYLSTLPGRLDRAVADRNGAAGQSRFELDDAVAGRRRARPAERLDRAAGDVEPAGASVRDDGSIAPNACSAGTAVGRDAA